MSEPVFDIALDVLTKKYAALKAEKLNLDLTRGKPSEVQLALSNPMLENKNVFALDGSDCRNYGHLEGLPEARKLFGEYLGVPTQNVFVLGNSSLAVMHDLVVQMLMRPVPGEVRRWDAYHNLRNQPVMLCPTPGYDRHHAICEHYGIRMLPVPMKDGALDIDLVESLVQTERNVFGIWCVPKYSNPTGITYSLEVCERLANMEAPPGFRIFWDNAYAVHDLTEQSDELPNLFELCCRAKGSGRQEHREKEDRLFVIGSTSKITFASAGLAMLAASERNLAWFRQSLSVQTIGHDKLNQLWHVAFLKDMAGIRAHMAKHRAILKPKFDRVDEVLKRELSEFNFVRWNRPKGGYFVNLFVPKGRAKRVVELAGLLGVKLTPAGAAFPYGKDPDDSHIRIAPTFPPLSEVQKAMEVVALCIIIATYE